MIKYSVAMGIRVVCLFVAVLVPGWWAAVPLIGAIFLPYFAVVIANVSSPRRAEVQRPGNILPMMPPPSAGSDDRQEDQ